MFEAPISARQRPDNPNQLYSHSRTRTTSSSVFPTQPQRPVQPAVQMLAQPQAGFNRRSPSVNTFSSVSSSGYAPPAAYRTSPPNDIRRSTSSRSGGMSGQSQAPQFSYVALLRRQKATVWCERAQFEDPRMTAQQRAARMRANREIVGSGGAYVSSGSGRTSTGLSAGGKVAAKIRHHGIKANTLGFGADSNYVGIGGVPLRLSATEVEGEDSDDDDAMVMARGHHRRTGSSGRSSTASGRRAPQFRSSSGALVPSASNSQGGSRRRSPGDTPERTGSLVQDQPVLNDAASGKARSTASGSSAERADNVPDLGSTAARLPANSANNASLTRDKSVRNAEDLRRRGSVDERTMTLSTGRLFIANPD